MYYISVGSKENMIVGVIRFVVACMPYVPGALVGALQGPILGHHTPRSSNGSALKGSLQRPILGHHTPRGPNGLALMRSLQGPILVIDTPRGPNRLDCGPNSCMHNNLGDPHWV